MRNVLEIFDSLVNVLETILSDEIEGEREPTKNDKLAALGDRLESMAMDIKDRTSS